MDEVDSPLIRPRQPKSRPRATHFQSELSTKLAERRSLGLTSGITSDESESDNDGIGELGFSSRARNRPLSAKRRPEAPDLGSTVRFPEHDIFNVTSKGTSKSQSKFLKKQATIEPSDEDYRSVSGLTAEDILYNKNTSFNKHDERMSPHSSRKSPLFGSLGEKRTEWQPPTYNKQAPSPDFLTRSSQSQISPSSSLDPIGQTSPRLESVRRKQQHQQLLEKSPRLEHIGGSPGKPSPRPRKTEFLDESKKKRRTPTMDLFGSSRITLDEEEEEEEGKLPSPQPKRRLSKDFKQNKQSEGRKTPTFLRKSENERTFGENRKSPIDGRKTPTGISGRKTPTDGRKTPTEGRKTPTGGRKTPTDRKMSADGRKTPNGNQFDKSTDKRWMSDDRRKEERKTMEDRSDRRHESATPSIMDLMVGDSTIKDKDYRSSYRKEKSNDSFTDEMEGYFPRSNKNDQFKARKATSSFNREHTDADRSSICEEYEVDPNPSSSHTETETQSKPNRSYKNQTEEHQVSDIAIDNVAGAQNKMQYIEPDKKKKSTKNDKQKPKPRYTNLPGENTQPITYDINDSKSMREAVFNEWSNEKLKNLKQEALNKKNKEKADAEKKEQEKKDKLLEAQSSFNAWSEKKKEDSKHKYIQKMKETRKQNEQQESQVEKQLNAKKCFEAWKETKDHIIKHQDTKKGREEQKKQRNEIKGKQERSKSASSAYRFWKDKKDDLINRKRKEERKGQPDLYEEEKRRTQKEEEARERYEIWLEEKEKRERREKDKKRHRYMTEEYSRPAWSPANRTVPFGR